MVQWKSKVQRPETCSKWMDIDSNRITSLLWSMMWGLYPAKNQLPLNDYSWYHSAADVKASAYWEATQYFYSLSFYVIFNFSFVLCSEFSCMLSWIISFLCRNLWLCPPLELIAELKFGGHHLILLQIGEVFSPNALFCFLLFYFIFILCIIVFSDIGDNVQFKFGGKDWKNDQIENFHPFD